MLGDEAINGYDPVAYFIANKAVKGKKTLHIHGMVLHGIFHQKRI